MCTIIEQKGSERKNNKGNWRQSWEECGCTEAQPFYLECAGGERVRIEPSEASDFVDDTGCPEGAPEPHGPSPPN